VLEGFQFYNFTVKKGKHAFNLIAREREMQLIFSLPHNRRRPGLPLATKTQNNI
jgi:hypothetical protein